MGQNPESVYPLPKRTWRFSQETKGPCWDSQCSTNPRPNNHCTEVLVGEKKNAGWFETLAGEKLRLKSSVVSELLTVSSEKRSVVADLVFTGKNRSSSLQDAAKCMKTDSKSLKSWRVLQHSASTFVGLEKNLTCQNCTRKFVTVKGWQVHESRYCGREEARDFAFSLSKSTIEMEWLSKMWKLSSISVLWWACKIMTNGRSVSCWRNGDSHLRVFRSFERANNAVFPLNAGFT